MSCGTELAVTEWAPSYERATWMQAPLALVGFMSAVVAWFIGSTVWWLVGGILLGLVLPFTIVVIMPTNKRLLSSDLDKSSEETRKLLKKWNVLHGVRTAPLASWLWSHFWHTARHASAYCEIEPQMLAHWGQRVG